MRSIYSLDAVGSPWSPEADQPLLPDSPITLALEDDDTQQRDFVEEMYRDLGVGD